MATPSQPVESRVFTTLESISKGVAGLAIWLYASGFLIVSLSHSKYGFIETNPFRPKILAAGTWFFILMGIPIATVSATVGGRLSWRQFIQFVSTYYTGCYLLAFLSEMLFHISTTSKPDAVNWWAVIGIVAILALLIFLGSSKKLPPDISSVASIFIFLFLVQHTVHELFIAHFFMSGAISLWFFGVGVVYRILLNLRSWNLTSADWSKTPFVVLGALLVFASYYYPHMRASLGGGSPLDAVLYFNKDSPIKPNQAVSVQLVEESDAGFYIVGEGESKAIFIPRNSVSLVYFSDNPSDSRLLK